MQGCGRESAVQDLMGGQPESLSQKAALHPWIHSLASSSGTARDIPAQLSLTHTPPPSQRFAAVAFGEKPVYASVGLDKAARVSSTNSTVSGLCSEIRGTQLDREKPRKYPKRPWLFG